MDGEDPIVERMRRAWERSGLSLGDVGEKMGYGKAVAKKAVWQLLNRTPDPKISSLRRFAKAVGISVRDLLDG